MSELRANTDIMRHGATSIANGGNLAGQAANKLGTLSNNVSGAYEGQLREKLAPILSGVSSEGSRLQIRSQETSKILFAKATEIDEVMLLGATTQISTETSSSSPLRSFFSRVRSLGLGTLVTVMGWAGIRSNNIPITHEAHETPTSDVSNTVSTRPNASFGQMLEQDRKERGEALASQYDGTSYAEGTYNKKDSYSARTITPPVTNTEDDRDPNIYNAVLNQFGVETNPRYESRNNNTYCNIYAWDATSAMGAEIPHWVDPNGNPVDVGKGRELNANSVVSWLGEHGNRYGWQAVSAEDAQAYANQGSPAVTVWANPNRSLSGHVAMVRPGEYLHDKGPNIAQAGAANLNHGYVNDIFSDKVIYYVHK
jgi:hypothetical protein